MDAWFWILTLGLEWCLHLSWIDIFVSSVWSIMFLCTSLFKTEMLLYQMALTALLQRFMKGGEPAYWSNSISAFTKLISIVLNWPINISKGSIAKSIFEHTCAYKICDIPILRTLRSSLKTLPYSSPTNDRVSQLGRNLIDTGSSNVPIYCSGLQGYWQRPST